MNKRTAARVQVWICFGLVAAVGGFVAALIWQSIHWPDQPPLAAKLPLLVPYWIAHAILWVLLSVAVLRLRRDPMVPSVTADPGISEVPQRRESAKVAAWIIAVAILARLVVVFTCEPRLSDDIWRYIHDGRTLAAGVNPYEHAPRDVAPMDSQHADLVARINHPHLVTIYQPVSQYVFAALALLQFEAWDPLGDRTFRLGFVVFDAALMAVLAVLLYREGRSPWWLVLYAWHPLSIGEVAAFGHQDVVGIFLLVAALCLARGASLGWCRAASAGAALAAAVAVKPIVLPLALVIAWSLRSQPKRLVVWALAAVAAGVALYAPLGLMAGGLDGMAQTGRVFLDKWAFNGSLHTLAQWWFDDAELVGWLMGLLLLAVLLGCLVRGCDLWRAAVVYLIAMLLLSSTAHPWYALWSLALLPVCFNAASWLLSLTIVWSYAAHLNQAYQPPAWLIWVEYIPVYAAVVWVGVHTAARDLGGGVRSAA